MWSMARATTRALRAVMPKTIIDVVYVGSASLALPVMAGMMVRFDLLVW